MRVRIGVGRCQMLMRSRAMIRVRLKKRDKVWIRASTRARAQEVLGARGTTSSSVRGSARAKVRTKMNVSIRG